MELLDLYDSERKPLGRAIERGQPIPPDCYHTVIHICVFNSAGELLIQQRQPFKAGWAGLWDMSVGGAVVSGETSRTAAERELAEELGLHASFAKERPVITIHYDHGFDDIYVLHKDIPLSELTLQPEEVQSADWADERRVLGMIDAGTFIPYNKNLISLLFAMRTRRGTFTRDDENRKGTMNK